MRRTRCSSVYAYGLGASGPTSGKRGTRSHAAFKRDCLPGIAPRLARAGEDDAAAMRRTAQKYIGEG